MVNLKHLQILTTPPEYLQMWHEQEEKYIHVTEMPRAYWQRVPRYLIARCPLCNEDYRESLDTYSLRWWVRATMGDYVFRGESNPHHCGHFVRVHHFINLNGLVPAVSPNELRVNKSLSSEVPHVMAPLLPDGVESYAVMHALPICRIEGDQFVPRYSLYLLTYYAPEPDIEPLLDRLRYYEPPGIERYDEYHHVELLFPPPQGEPGEAWWDLPRWVQAGRLLWLDPDDPALPLRSGPVEAFPYANIPGRRWPYYVTVPPFEPSPERKRTRKKPKQ